MGQIDVGIVTMKEEEFEAVLDQLGEHSALPTPNTRRYEEATVRAGSTTIRVAMTRCEQGNGPAQEAVDELIADLSPSFVLVVGIAGAPPTQDLTLGDVVVSSYIYDLTLQDTGTGGERRFNARGGPLHRDAAALVGSLKAVERRQRGWQGAIGRERPVLTGEHTTTDKAWNDKIDAAFASHAKKGRQQPIVTAQPIGASDLLVKDPKYVQQWKTVLKGIAAVEMESAGAHRASTRANVPLLAIRGISDIVGWERDEAWTLYACHSAAAFMMALLRSGELLPLSSVRAPRTPEERQESAKSERSAKPSVIINKDQSGGFNFAGATVTVGGDMVQGDKHEVHHHGSGTSEPRKK